MIKALFGLLPWWVFAFLAVNMAPLAVQFFEDYQSDQAALEQARVVGPPDMVQVRQLNNRNTNTPLGEVQVNGALRADLSVRRIFFSETQYTYVLMGQERSGPLVAVLFPTDEAETKLTTLVNATDDAGRVTVRGFLAPARAGEVSRMLARSDGISRPLYVVEPYFGSREDALSARVSDSAFNFFGAAAITAFLVAMTVLRWRRSKARGRARQRQQTLPPAPTPAAVTPPSASPWGTFKAQSKPQGVKQDAGAVKPQTLPPAQTRPARAKAPANDVAPTIPPFKSVFPGGGSQFQFKSADQIIRQSFGTFRTIKRPPVAGGQGDPDTKAGT